MKNTVKFTLFSALFLLFSSNLFAREIYQGWCQQGNQTVANGGITSSTKVQRSFPSCTITVYLKGTVTFATLYSDEAGTSLTNPFNNQSTSTGQYFFYADNGYYDVQIQATGLTTYTIFHIGLGGSGGTTQNCTGFPGDDATRLVNCVAALPSTGGEAVTGMLANQTWSSCPFTGFSTKPVTVTLTAGITTLGVNCTVPSNTTLQMNTGAILSMAGTSRLTINGSLLLDNTKHFINGSGGVTISSVRVPLIYPQWWGAVGDGVADDWPAAQAAMDSVTSAASLNVPEVAPSGVIYFQPGTYLVSQAISTCHFDGCPGNIPRAVPAGATNACVTLKGDGRGASVISSTANIDNIQMFNWACPSAVRGLMVVASGQDASHAAIRVKGNETTIENNWFLASIGILVDSPGPSANGLSLDTAGTKILHNQCDWINSGGGVVNCVYIQRTAGAALAPQGLTIEDLDCYGGNLCIFADHLFKSIISDVRSNHGGAGIIQFSGNPGDIDSVAISNVVGDAATLTVQSFEFGIKLEGATNINISNYVANGYQGQAFYCRNGGSANITNYNFINNVQNAGVANPFDVFADQCILHMSNGTITNNTGHSTLAMQLGGSSLSGYYAITNTLITGSVYTGTTINVATGIAGIVGFKMDNVTLLNVNSSGGATPDIILGAVASGLATFSHMNLFHLGAPTNWLLSTYYQTTLCVDHNVTAGGGNISLTNSSMMPVAFSGQTDGCFFGALSLNATEVAAINNRGIFLNTGPATFGSTVEIDGNTTLDAAVFMHHGTDATAANNLALTHNGNFFVINGNTTINCIDNTFTTGPLYFLINGTPTFTHGFGGCPGGYAPIILDSSANWVAAVNSTITLLAPNGGEWVQFGRKQ